MYFTQRHLAYFLYTRSRVARLSSCGATYSRLANCPFRWRHWDWCPYSTEIQKSISRS